LRAKIISSTWDLPRCFVNESTTGVVDYLNTEISTSKQKKFPLVTFVDTPGLVDGDMKYPFDVNEAIIWLGNYMSKSLSAYRP
jgi:hypothetical protein